MKRFAIVIGLVLITINAFSQQMNFKKEFDLIIENDNYDMTINWLQNNKKMYDKYMNGMPKNVATIAYKKHKINAMKATIDFDITLLQIFIGSTAGGHSSEPPTIFQCVEDDNLECVKYFMEKGVDPKITWDQVAFFPENLYSIAKTKAMKELLLKYSCPKNIKIKDYVCKSIDNNINVRMEPNISSKILFIVNIDVLGKIDEITSENEIIDNQKNRWYHIIFKDGKSGWSFGQFYHVPWLDGT